MQQKGKIQEGKTIEEVIAGVSEFQETVAPGKDRHKRLEALSKYGQHPKVLFITCSDSRVPPNIITHTDLGDLFVIRNAGNIVPPHEAEAANGMSASVEYAVESLKVEHIVVCGHTDCGAMDSAIENAMNPSALKALPQVRGWLKHAEAPLCMVDALQPGLARDARLRALVEQNVLVQMANLRTHPCVKKRMDAGSLELHGWVYKIESGDVSIYDEKAAKKGFVPL